MRTAPRPFRPLLLALSLLLGILPAFAQTAPATARTQSSSPEFDRLVAAVRADGSMPGIAALGFRDGRLWASAQGVRRLGSVDNVRIDDRFHIGSNIKSMTATVIAELVERRQLRWNSTLGALFPDVPMHPAYRRVTLEQLLQHRAGRPALPVSAVASLGRQPVGEPRRLRQVRAAACGSRLRSAATAERGQFPTPACGVGLGRRRGLLDGMV
jgi:CubicO group peptidase (beta-lactamase class C family)